MRQVIVDAPGKNSRIVILNDDVKTAREIAGGPRIKSSKRPKTERLFLTRGRGASLWVTATFLAATWTPGVQGFAETGYAQAEALASSQRAAARSNVDFGGTTGSRDFEMAQVDRADDKSVRFAQATTRDTEELQKALEKEHAKADLLARELTITRHLEMLLTLHKARAESAQFRQVSESEYAELRKSLKQERDRVTKMAESGSAELCQFLQGDRADRLEQDLAAAKRDVETRTALAAKASDDDAKVKQAAESGAVELQKSLQQERARAEQLEKDLAATKRDVETQTALAAKAGDDAAKVKQAAESGAVELQKSLQRERERAERLEKDLAAARRDVETQTALAAKANDNASQLKQAAVNTSAELKQSLQKEHDRADALAQDLSTTRTKIYAYEAQAGKASDQAVDLKRVEGTAAELRKSLQQERERAARLEQDLAAARRDVETQTALAAKANDNAAKVKQATESGAVELQKSLQQERARAERLEEDLAAARRNVETQTVLAAKASDNACQLKQVAQNSSAELKPSMQMEHDRAEALAPDLSMVRTAIYAFQVQARKNSDLAAGFKPAAESSAAELGKSLQQEPERERELASERSKKDASAAPAVATAGQVTRDKKLEAGAAKPVLADQVTAAEARGTAEPNPGDSAEVARLVARANVLLGQGDISSARIVLERAADGGSAQASFILAETYDPLVLPIWGTYGTRGDARKARDLYAKAQAGGIKEAKERFDALRR